MNALQVFESVTVNSFGLIGVLITSLFLSGSILSTIESYKEAIKHGQRVLPKIFTGLVFDAVIDLLFVMFFFISLGMKTAIFLSYYYNPSPLTLGWVYVMIVTETFLNLSSYSPRDERRNKLSNRV